LKNWGTEREKTGRRVRSSRENKNVDKHKERGILSKEGEKKTALWGKRKGKKKIKISPTAKKYGRPPSVILKQKSLFNLLGGKKKKRGIFPLNEGVYWLTDKNSGITF